MCVTFQAWSVWRIKWILNVLQETMLVGGFTASPPKKWKSTWLADHPKQGSRKTTKPLETTGLIPSPPTLCKWLTRELSCLYNTYCTTYACFLQINMYVMVQNGISMEYIISEWNVNIYISAFPQAPASKAKTRSLPGSSQVTHLRQPLKAGCLSRRRLHGAVAPG
jgi:hypothetical protein